MKNYLNLPKMPTITNPFKGRNDGKTSGTDGSANETGSTTQTRSLPHYPVQDGRKSFSRFQHIFNKGPSGPSRQSLEMARIRQQTRSEKIASMEQESHNKIDLCMKSDWAGFVSNRHDLAEGVDKLLSNISAANEKFKQTVSAEIRSFSDRIDHEMEDARSRFKQEAKQETRKTAKERLAMGFARTAYKERMAQRKDIEQKKLDAFEAEKMGGFRQRLTELENMHPMNLQDEGTVYFRQFADGVPQPLQDMMTHITDHALKVMSGEIGTESDSLSVNDGGNVLPNEVSSRRQSQDLQSGLSTHSRQSSTASTASFTSALSSISGGSFVATSNGSVNSGRASTVSTGGGSFVTANNGGEDPKRATIVTESGPEHHFSARPATLPPTDAEITAAVDFFGGDSLDSNLKRFLEDGALPDAKVNERGEAEWVPKK